jgi:hypothetical protein
MFGKIRLDSSKNDEKRSIFFYHLDGNKWKIEELRKLKNDYANGDFAFFKYMVLKGNYSLYLATCK